MAYYEDLSPCDYFGDWPDTLRAVGWLEHDHPFETGSTEKVVIDRLADFLASAVQMPLTWALVDKHICSLCLANGVPPARYFTSHGITVPVHETEDCWNGVKIVSGRRNLFIPAKGKQVYVAPSTILHYIVEHNYRPPAEFQTALIAPKWVLGVLQGDEIPRSQGVVLVEDSVESDLTPFLI